MKNLLTVAGLFVVLFVFGLFVASQVSEAQTSVVANLLDLPAPPPPNPLAENSRQKRSEDFYDKKNAPKDDAPIEDLLDYWKAQNRFDPQTDFTVKPSSETLRRIFAEIEKEPETLSAFLNILPNDSKEVAEFVKRIYDADSAASDNESLERNQLTEIKDWLTHHTDYFIEDLYKTAQQARDADEYVTNQEAVLALATVDWDRARPLLEKMLANDSQPVSQTLARWAFYRHAMKENDASDAERFRRDLQAAVENKSGKPGNRDLAMDALVLSGDFDGRDDWYYKLLSDETLYDLRSAQNSPYTGLTTLLNHSPPEKYLAKMLELVRSDNRAIRSAAARNLSTMLDEKNLEIIRALLPWLENPDWAKETGGERRALVEALSKVEIPESVPGLIATLNEKSADVPDGDSIGDGVMSNTNMRAVVGARENYQFRNAAISALTKQKDVRAIAPLRQLLPSVEEYERGNVVRALLASRGFSVPEQIEALETVAQAVAAQTSAFEAAAMNQADTLTESSMSNMTNGFRTDAPPMPPRITIQGNTAVVVNSMSSGSYAGSVSNGYYARTYNPSDIKFVLGSQLVSISEVDGELVAAVIDRIGELDKKNPPLASALRKIMQNWSGAAVNSLLLRDLKNGRADTNAVVKLLSVRGDLREKQAGEVHDLRAGDNPVALGVAACLLEDANVYDQILGSANADVKTAMLACARLVRAKLPVPAVAENLRGADKSLALAAERYLESEDSPEARRIVLSLHPNEAKILGATTAFTVANARGGTAAHRFLTELFASVGNTPVMPYYMLLLHQNSLEADEKLLQKELKETDDLLGVYAYDKNFIRIYKDKAVFSWEEDEARYRERALDGEEYSRLKSYVAAQRADELAPFLTACDGCESKEFLMLGRAGGRRVFYRGTRAPAFFAELERMFKEMREPPARLRYRLEKSVAGLEVVFADERLQARAVWKNADDFRVLLDDRQRRKQIDRELDRLDELEMEKEDFDYEKGEEALQKRRQQRAYENLSWRKIERGGQLGDAAAQPQTLEYIPLRDNSPAQANERQWKARTAANLEIRVGDTDGLYKIARGQTTKIRAGNYDKPVVTPDGRWAVLTKYDDDAGAALVRVNLPTGKEFKIKTERNQRFEPVAFNASVNKFLIFAGDNMYEHYEQEETAQRNGKYFLLDAETGLMQPGKGEFRPLAQQTFRALQPTATADEFWAAIPDAQKKETRVGIYNAKTFAFKSLLAVPQIKFDSMNLWADESGGKIYFVYEGHLLALPLPKAGK